MVDTCRSDAVAFFSEEDYENFSLKPRFDVDLFKVYNAVCKGCTVSSPVKKRKTLNVKKNPTEKSTQLLPSSPTCDDQIQNNINHDVVSHASKERPQPSFWTLKSPQPQFPYPRYSSLTHAQQQQYLELWQKHGVGYSNKAKYTSSPESITEKQQLRKLQILVHQEQQEFMKYAEHVARHIPKDYEQVPPSALHYIQKRWQSQEQRVRNLPQFYSVHQTIGIVPAAVFPTDPVLTFASRLLVLGEPGIVVESTFSSKLDQNVTKAYQRQSHVKLTAGRKTTDVNDETKELHDDENAVKLAAKYQASVVIATMALATLADNHAPGFDKNWQIPVHIQATRFSDTESLGKTVFVGEPLTNQSFPHEANKTFHSVALRALLTQDVQGQSSFSDPDCEVKLGKNYGLSSNYEDNLELDLSDLETFGSSYRKRDSKTCKEKGTGQKPGHQRNLSENNRKDAETEHDASEKKMNQFPMGTSLPGHPTDDKSISGIKTMEFTPQSPDSEISTHELVECKEERTSCIASHLEKSYQENEMLVSRLNNSAQPKTENSNSYQGSNLNVDRNATALQSDSSEGELVIAFMSDPESPKRKSNRGFAAFSKGMDKQDLVDKNTREKMRLDLAEDKQPNQIDGIEPRARQKRSSSEMSLDAGHTPRRSSRLKKHNQSDNLPMISESSDPLENITCSSLINQSESKPNSKAVSSFTPEEGTGGIPDSPLSPPPNEKGLNNVPVIPESPMSPPFTEQKGQTLIISCPADARWVASDCSKTELKLENAAPCKRYNLRSKTVMAENEEQNVMIVSKADDNQSHTCTLSSQADGMPGLNSVSENTTKELHEPSQVSVTENLTFILKEPTSGAENDNFHDNSEKDSCTIGQQHDIKTPKTKPALKRKTKQYKESGEESTVDSILKLQERLHSSKMADQSPPPQLPMSVPCMQSEGDVCLENTSNYNSGMIGNVDYSLWKFGKISVLVRSSVDAISAPSIADNLGKGQVTTIRSKMEYQPHFGHEQISVSELTKLWMSLLLQPGSKVIQGRVNALTSDLMLLEHFDMNSSIWDQPSFQPSRCMKMMYQVLDKLTTLPEGHYLLCHSAGDMHVCILRTAVPTGKTRSFYNLHMTHVNVPVMQPCPPSLLPWLPLDTNLMTPGHMAAGRIPATFPPKCNFKNATGNVAMGTRKKKKRKKGGKK